jgi:protein-tyrosine phosphatase
MDTSELPIVVPLEGGSNFRDLGGYATSDGRKIKHGAVFRSAHLGTLTDADRRTMSKLGVRTIVDLRGVSEAAETPHRVDGVGCRIVGAHIEPGVGEKIRGALADGTANPFVMMGFLTDH